MKMKYLKAGIEDTSFNKGDSTMSNIIISNASPTTMMEYMVFLERKEKEKKEARRRFWSKVGTAILCMLCGAGISTTIMLAVIGLTVVL